jgi:hypothetical protein
MMRSNQRQSVVAYGALAALAIAMGAISSATLAQETRDSQRAESARPAEPTLAERQRLVRDRLQRLESSMLKLSGLLAESEPAKAERLRDALRLAGSRRIKERIKQLTTLLETDQLSEADRQQELLLADLDALLVLLTSSLNEVERRRAERQRLEALKQAVRALIDEQTQILYRTQHVEQRAGPSNARQPGDVVSDDIAEMLRQLEQLQRIAQRSADELHRDMHESDEQGRPTVGAPQISRAVDEMQRAADRLGESDPGGARQNQLGALEELQNALDELDDALRQVRREESEETLAALEVRLESMLMRERRVFEVVVALDEKGVDNWTRVDQLQLSESAETQRGVREDCEDTRRILVDEGTTVIVPELIEQMAGDMAAVSDRLDRSDTSPETQRVLADIIALLEEVLQAVERKREADARREEQGQSAGDRPRALLPGSAELKLLRGSQLRLNQRAGELAKANAAAADDRAEAVQRLSQRQRRLADLARRMNERE